jgi:predicted nucleic acid-binding protein
MKTLYLDVCVLCRPFDDQNRLRIRLETDAVFLILRRIETGLYRAVVSPAHYREVGAIRETSERLEMESLLSRLDKSCECDLTQARHRAEALIDMGFGIADAAHVAFAEQLAEFFITCDDKLLKRCTQTTLRIAVMSPLEFIAQEEP